MVNIAHDDETRGDVAGWRGLAHEVSQKLGGTVIEASKAKLKEAFPDQWDKVSYDVLLAQFLKAASPPSWVFGHKCEKTLNEIGQNPEDVHWVWEVNEWLSEHHLGEKTLVSHNLTQEQLATEGEVFDKRHPFIKKPIIAVMIVSVQDPELRKAFAERIVSVMANYPEASIYLCGSRRTWEKPQAELIKEIGQEIERQNLGNKLDLYSHEFSYKAPYNPYLGLIARAKHFVIYGDSQSMLSECLFSGKTVYVYDFEEPHKLVRQKLVAMFNNLTGKSITTAREFTPVNFTERLARKLVSNANEADRKAKDRIAQTIQGIKKSWIPWLDAIRKNFESAQDLPDHLRRNRAFAKAALSIRGHAWPYFPAFAQDPELAASVVRQNKNALPLIDTKLYDNSRFICDVATFDFELAMQLATPELKNQDAFAHSIMDINSAAFRHLSTRLQHNKPLLRHLIKNCLITPEAIPFTARNNSEILMLLLEQSPHIISQHPEYSNNPDFAAKAVRKKPSSYRYFSEAVRDNDKLTDLAVRLNNDNFSVAPASQKARKKLALKAILQNPYMVIHLPEHLKKDTDIATLATSLAPSTFAYLDTSIRTDAYFVRKTIHSSVERAKSVPPSFFENNMALTSELCLKHGISLFELLPPNLKKQDSVRIAAIRHDPKMASKILSSEDFRNPRFMRAMATINRLTPDIMSGADVPPAAVKLMAYLRPDWLAHRSFRELNANTAKRALGSSKACAKIYP